MTLTTDEQDSNANVVAAPGSGPVKLRARGPRDLDDIPLEEIVALAGLIDIPVNREPPTSGEDLNEEDEAEYRKLLDAYGLKRLTETAKQRLRMALDLLRS